MMNYKRLLLATAAAVAVFTQGCGCSSDNRGSETPVNQEPSTFNLMGTASKGILVGFSVSAYPIVDGVVAQTAVATALTTASGSYSLAVPEDYVGQPMVIRVTPAASGSVMRCDLSTGCGDGVAFGGDLPIAEGSGFSLDAVVASAAAEESTNVTLLTNLASSLALEALGSASDASAVSLAIAQANSQVANRFGITGDLTQMPVVDLTNSTALAAALSAGNTAAVQYAALNAAVIQAVRQDNATLGVAAALDSFVSSFTTEGLAGNTTDAAETSLADILGAAQAVLETVSSSTVDLGAVIDAVEAERDLALLEPADNYDQGTASDSAGASGLQKAKAMVAGLRDFSTSLSGVELGGSGTIASVSDQFATQIEAAELVTSGDINALVMALARVGSAIDDARAALAMDETLSRFVSDDGIEVRITLRTNAPVFAVGQSVQVASDLGTSTTVNVELSATDGLIVADNSTETNVSASANGAFSVTGTLATQAASLTIANGSTFAVTSMAAVVQDDPTTGTISEAFDLDALDLSLAVTLQQKTSETVTDPVAITGSISASVAGVLMENTESLDSQSSSVSMEMAELSFSGEIANTSGEKYKFAFSATGDGTGVSFDHAREGEVETSSGETETNYVDFHGNLTFTADLAGIPSAVLMSYNVERTGLDDFTHLVTVRYPGNTLRIQATVVDGEPSGGLTITNQDGVVMTVQEVPQGDNAVLEGTIKLNGTEYATISEETIGTVVITYSDGSFESL